MNRREFLQQIILAMIRSGVCVHVSEQELVAYAVKVMEKAMNTPV